MPFAGYWPDHRGGVELAQSGIVQRKRAADVTTCRGARTDAAELTGTTWPVTSQIEQVADRGKPLL